MNPELQLSIETVNKATTISEKIKTLITVISYCTLNSNYKVGSGYIKEAVDIIEGYSEEKETLGLLTCVGNYYTKIGDYAKSIEYHNKAVVISKKISDKLHESKSVYNLGIVYYYLGDYSKALEYVLECLDIVNSDPSIESSSLYYNSLGEIYRQMGNHELALLNLFHSLDLLTEGKTNNRVKGLSLQNIGSVYMSCKDFEHSNEYYGKALELFQKERLLEHEALVLNNLGALYGTFEQYSQAIQNLQKAISIHEQIGGLNKDAICNTLSNLAEAYSKVENNEMSLQCLTKALSIAEVIDAKHRLLEIHDGFYTVYKSIGDYKKALHHHELYLNYKEQVYNQHASDKLQKMSVLHQVEFHKKETEIEHKKNEQLNKINKKLKDLNEEKDGFLAIAAHDLKNPLTGVIYIANAMRTGSCSPEEIIEFGEMLRSSAQAMFNLITNLLDSNRFENGTIEPNITTIDSAQLVRHLTKNYKQNALTKDINVHCKTPTHSFVLADMQLLRQAIDNLLSNAVKYSAVGSDIYIDIVDNRVEKSVVEIRVKDSGPGISYDDQKKLFGKFQRLSAKPTGGEHSSGLGLSICKKLVEMMNGSIYCESQLGYGATFVIVLPSAEEEQIEV